MIEYFPFSFEQKLFQATYTVISEVGKSIYRVIIRSPQPENLPPIIDLEYIKDFDGYEWRIQEEEKNNPFAEAVLTGLKDYLIKRKS